MWLSLVKAESIVRVKMQHYFSHIEYHDFTHLLIQENYSWKQKGLFLIFVFCIQTNPICAPIHNTDHTDADGKYAECQLTRFKYLTHVSLF